MPIAHIAGVPFEEWVAPLTIGGSGVAYALTWVRRRGGLPALAHHEGDCNPYDDGGEGDPDSAA